MNKEENRAVRDDCATVFDQCRAAAGHFLPRFRKILSRVEPSTPCPRPTHCGNGDQSRCDHLPATFARLGKRAHAGQQEPSGHEKQPSCANDPDDCHTSKKCSEIDEKYAWKPGQSPRGGNKNQNDYNPNGHCEVSKPWSDRIDHEDGLKLGGTIKNTRNECSSCDRSNSIPAASRPTKEQSAGWRTGAHGRRGAVIYSCHG